MVHLRVQLELDSGDSWIVEEPIGALQSKHLFLTEEGKDLTPDAKADLDLEAFLRASILIPNNFFIVYTQLIIHHVVEKVDWNILDRCRVLFNSFVILFGFLVSAA